MTQASSATHLHIISASEHSHKQKSSTSTLTYSTFQHSLALAVLLTKRRHRNNLCSLRPGALSLYRAHLASRLEAVLDRHVDIEQYEIRFKCQELAYSVFSVDGLGVLACLDGYKLIERI